MSIRHRRLARRVALAGAALGLAVLAAACSRTGMGDAVRKDVTERMTSARDPLAACYEAALKQNRKLRGVMVLTMTAEAKTGRFRDVQVARDDLGDAGLAACVVERVSALKLAKPQSTTVSIEYPLDFAPVD